MKAQKLFDILEKNEILEITGNTDVEVIDLTLDSRRVKPGFGFLALRGTQTDGHRYIQTAIEAGARLIVSEEAVELPEGVVGLRLRSVQDAAGILAHHFYGNNTGTMKAVGVTGTNGKSTVVTLLHQMCTAMDVKCGLISTIENRIGDEIIESTHTTPDAISLAKLIRQMREEDCRFVFMEASSHGIHQRRIAGLDFAGGVFTNITHDHLDYHGTMKDYIYAKKRFFDDLSKEAFAVTNLDEKNGMVMVQNSRAKIYTYGLKSMADCRIKVIDDGIYGLHLRLNDAEMHCRLTGKFNAYNLGAVYLTALGLGLKEEKILPILSTLSGPRGRMEKVVVEGRKNVGIVDYAHTPDALENVLKTLKASLLPDAKLIAVVGCGGNRDKAKRPLMAKTGKKYADLLVLTSDNPRDEDPESILDEMEVGIKTSDKTSFLRIVDRRSAIKTAVLLAGKGDVILVAGKGHETYQEIKGEKYPFDDKKILMQALEGSI